MRTLMSSGNLISIPVANVKKGTSEGKPSRDRVMCSLFDRASDTQPSRPTIGRLWRSIAKDVVIGIQTRGEHKTAHGVLAPAI
jgi:hypothetical protein